MGIKGKQCQTKSPKERREDQNKGTEAWPEEGKILLLRGKKEGKGPSE